MVYEKEKLNNWIKFKKNSQTMHFSHKYTLDMVVFNLLYSMKGLSIIHPTMGCIDNVLQYTWDPAAKKCISNT